MAEVQFRFRDDESVTDASVTVDAFIANDFAQSNATAVRVEPGDDVRALLPQLDRLALVEINFPAWTDGRGYSAARILREAGYQGEIRAVGDVVIDMLHHLKRCGFDAFAPEHPLNPDDARNAFERWENVYQATAIDGRPAIWARRHPAAQNSAA